jgi:hypothetical protein
MFILSKDQEVIGLSIIMLHDAEMPLEKRYFIGPIATVESV